MLTYGTNSLGAHFNPAAVCIVPYNMESTESYSVGWDAIERALHRLLKAFKTCPMRGCEVCQMFDGLRATKEFQEYVASDLFALRAFPWLYSNGDNSNSWDGFSDKKLKVKRTQCQTHTAGGNYKIYNFFRYHPPNYFLIFGSTIQNHQNFR